ncbi:MAG: hypothetical protein IJE97_16500 [Thermoguttaceae bacterium]|nr:hypothetical protein [Thermoguttaceae bacterium]
MKKLLALLFAAVPCAALAADAPVYSPSPCEPVAAPVCGPVGENVAVESNAETACPGGVCSPNVNVGTACPGGVCSLNVNVGTACPGGVCPLGANACENGRCETDVGGASGFCSVAVGSNVGVGGAKKVRAWSTCLSATVSDQRERRNRVRAVARAWNRAVAVAPVCR